MNAEKWYDEQLPMDFHNAVLSRDDVEIWKYFKQWMLTAYKAGYEENIKEVHELTYNRLLNATLKGWHLTKSEMS